MNITLARPWILAFIPIAVGILLYSGKFIRIKNKSTKGLQIGVRIVIVSLLLCSLSGIGISKRGNMITTIFVVDASESVKERIDEEISFVNEAIKNKSLDDKVGIVAFGGNAGVESFVSDTPIFTSLQTDINAEATDLESAVSLALTLIPSNSAKRIVILSDGAENEGNIRNTITSVIAQGCNVKAYRLKDTENVEAYVSDLKTPDKVGIGEYFNITVEIESNSAMSSVVNLYMGRTLKDRRTVNLQRGKNTFIFRDIQTDEGMKEYKVTIEPEKDAIGANNEYSAYTNIAVQKPILIVEGKNGEAAEFSNMVKSFGIAYDVVMPEVVPNTLSDLLKYSSVIFVDVYANDLRKGFMDILEPYIKEYGGGFIVCGGKNSFALGNYRDTVIEKVLPVNMEPKAENEVPSTAMELVIDRSGSMTDGNSAITNIDLAKEAAIAAIETLRTTDYVGVIAFDSMYSKVVPLSKNDDRQNAINRISQIRADGGTSIRPALAAALDDLEKNDAKIKHIILLTDGQDSSEDYEKLIKRANDCNITVSTVAVGGGCNYQLLSMLAEECGGRIYYTDINTDVPRIFTQEVFLSAKSYIVDDIFVPGVVSNDEIIKNVTAEGLPYLKGYIATMAKSTATQLLVSKKKEPVLCYWQYGLGRSVAWTSDVTANWSGEWVNFKGNQLMWHNLIRFVTEDRSLSGSYAEVVQNGTLAKVSYTTDTFGVGTSVVATITDDEGNVRVVDMFPQIPGVYVMDVVTDHTGVYSINIGQYENGELQGSLMTAAIMQYSPEYTFNTNKTLLEEYTASVNGKMIGSPKQVFQKDVKYVDDTKDIGTELLIAALLIFILDIACRRFRWSLSFGTKKRVKKKAEKSVEAKNFESVMEVNPEKTGSSETDGAGTKSKDKASKDKKAKEDKNDKDKGKGGKGGSGKKQTERLDTSKLLNRMK